MRGELIRSDFSRRGLYQRTACMGYLLRFLLGKVILPAPNLLVAVNE